MIVATVFKTTGRNFFHPRSLRMNHVAMMSNIIHIKIPTVSEEISAKQDHVVKAPSNRFTDIFRSTVANIAAAGLLCLPHDVNNSFEEATSTFVEHADTITDLATSLSPVAFSSMAGASLAFPAALGMLLKFSPPIMSQLVFLSPMGTMKEFKKNETTGDVSPIPYAAMCANSALWVAYGALRGDPTIILPNVSGFFFGAYYMHTFGKYKADNVEMMPYYGGVAAVTTAVLGMVTMMDTATACNAVGTLGCVVVAVMFGGPLGSIKTVIKEKDTSSLPVVFTVSSFMSCVMWSSYGWFVINDPFTYGPSMLGLMASMAQISLYAKFGLPKTSK